MLSKDLESSNVPKKKDSFFFETVKFIFVSLLIVLPIRFWIAQPFIVSGASMEPTFHDGEYLIVDEISYRFTEPKAGDIVVFRPPTDDKLFYIKRIIATPGATVIIKGKDIYIKDAEHPEGYKIDEPYLVNENSSGDSYTFTLGKNEYFVMGDNRPASSDSRIWGPLRRENIVGKTFVRLFPFSRIELEPGDVSHYQ